ncbi:putative nicotinamide N-methyltransferase [Metschnikowia bicuspidata]|uniref:Protein N-terminal and lysine N-methyltransferase EFM7 n=1 Tax=Metschnikowia bicuspidata TaxID=27322 RepID=A0A4P9ZFZ4_9ASCO|nr:putative nicotinamide N-methyltransferase [Metschnikowia bicuspidata]
MPEAEDLELGDLFAEPEDFRPPPPDSHFVTYNREAELGPSKITLKLVGKSPLWGHLLWNAGKYTAQYLDENASSLVTGKKILELGAAAGLPSLICGVNNALRVVCTDYPDPDLLSHTQYNVDHCDGIDPANVVVRGFIWGQDETQLCYDELAEDNLPSEIKEEDKFDLIILSDLIFNHTEHEKLLTNCRRAVKRTGVALVVFSPHRPKLLENDLGFFTKCENYDFKAKMIDQVNWKPMFNEDDETIEIRSRVYCYHLVPQW